MIASSVRPDPFVDNLALVATLASCCVIFSPLGSILTLMKSSPAAAAKDSKGLLLPYGMLFAQSFLWVFYGIATLNQPIVRINVLGTVISMTYLVILTKRAPEPERQVIQSALCCGVG